jgi:hypothetical protein
MHAKVYHIPKEITPNAANDKGIDEKSLNTGLAYLRSINAAIKYGDLVIFDQIINYRNDAHAIYDGDNIINLASDPDEYGTLPKQFQVLSPPHYFPIDYWHGFNEGIRHNTIVWVNHRPYQKELLSSIQQDPTKKFALISNFTGPDNQTYQLVVEFEERFDYDCDIASGRIVENPDGYKVNLRIPRSTEPLTNDYVEKMKEIFREKIDAETILSCSTTAMETESFGENTLYLIMQFL